MSRSLHLAHSARPARRRLDQHRVSIMPTPFSSGSAARNARRRLDQHGRSPSAREARQQIAARNARHRLDQHGLPPACCLVDWHRRGCERSASGDQHQVIGAHPSRPIPLLSPADRAASATHPRRAVRSARTSIGSAGHVGVGALCGLRLGPARFFEPARPRPEKDPLFMRQMRVRLHVAEQCIPGHARRRHRPRLWRAPSSPCR